MHPPLRFCTPLRLGCAFVSSFATFAKPTLSELVPHRGRVRICCLYGQHQRIRKAAPVGMTGAALGLIEPFLQSILENVLHRTTKNGLIDIIMQCAVRSFHNRVYYTARWESSAPHLSDSPYSTCLPSIYGETGAENMRMEPFWWRLR